jgi:Concanavalin A-like lectin/glucanases superfamily
MLIGRKVGQYNQQIVRPGAASLSLTGKAPSLSYDFLIMSLNHFEESDGSTTFIDEVPGVTWSTPFGSAETDTAQAKFGSSSLLVIPNDGIVRAAITVNTSIYTEYTFEGFVRFDTVYSLSSYIGIGLGDSTNGLTFWLRMTPPGDNFSWGRTISPGGTGSGGLDPQSTWEPNVWFHWAIVKAATTLDVFFNGNRINQESISTAKCPSHQYLELSNTTTSDTSSAWFDETRFITTAVYSGATYTPPLSAFSYP